MTGTSSGISSFFSSFPYFTVATRSLVPTRVPIVPLVIVDPPPFDGAVYAFRGRRAALIKLLWHDRGRPMHADQAVGARPVRLAVGDVHRADRTVGGATGGPARRVRMARPGGTAPTGAGGL